MPLTAVAFLIGWLSIAGVPPLIGFWSKSDVLDECLGRHRRRCGRSARVTAVLTAYYMGREYFLVFRGVARWSRLATAATGTTGCTRTIRAAVMTLPLVVLAICSVFGGFIDLPFHPHSTSSSAGSTRWSARPLVNHHDSVARALGVRDRRRRRWRSPGSLTAVALWRGVGRPSRARAALLCPWPGSSTGPMTASSPARRRRSPRFTSIVDRDRKVIDGAVNGVARLGARRAASRLRKVQNGYVRNYALGLVGRRGRARRLHA